MIPFRQFYLDMRFDRLTFESRKLVGTLANNKRIQFINIIDPSWSFQPTSYKDITHLQTMHLHEYNYEEFLFEFTCSSHGVREKIIHNGKIITITTARFKNVVFLYDTYTQRFINPEHQKKEWKMIIDLSDCK